MGLVFDPARGRDRVVHALIFTACFSRHCFVWLTHRQTTEAVIAGCEAAWVFFGGVFATLIPDNLSAVVDGADALEPRFNQAFIEYAQTRGFKIDPARVRSPQDKPRVERQVQFVRGSFFAGEGLHRSRRRTAPSRDLVPGAGRVACSWHDPAATRRGVHRRRAAPAGPASDGALRRAGLRDREGAP
jgi:transposase